MRADFFCIRSRWWIGPKNLRTADFSANERAKIKSDKKLQPCLIITVKNYKVVFKWTTSNPTTDHGFISKDKYLNYSTIYVLKKHKLLQNLKPTCQICFVLFFTKNSNILQAAATKAKTAFPQIPAILNSFAASSFSFKKCIYNVSDKFFNYFFSPINLLFVSKQFSFSKLLTSGDVEQNPGPQKPPLLTIKTYNARGLKSRSKLKRVLNSCYKIISENRNSVIFLQETHLEDCDKTTIDMMWRHKYVMSPGTNRQCGCLILFDPSWEVVDHETDNEGRFCLVILNNFDSNFIFSNIYAPNDHNLNFFSNVFNSLINAQTAYPNSNTILAGDFNFVLSNNDAANRVDTNAELQCRILVKRNLKRLDLQDSYRLKYEKKGFTWSRGSCMSRLDMIFISKNLSTSITDTKVSWSFDDSDHAMLESSFIINTKFSKGPGLIRVDADILDREDVLAKVKSELRFQLNQIPDHWDPHFKLDFVKSALRSIIAEAAGKKRKCDNLDKLAIVDQINMLFSVKEKIVTGEINNVQLLSDINQTISTLEAEHKLYLDEISKKLSIRAQTKWFDEGERSNKYFLNIIKKRTNQTSITKLVATNNTLTSQPDIMTHITSFYTDLYDEKHTDTNYDDLLSDLPTLNDTDRSNMDREITLDELQRTLNECGDTAPGPDGIPYKIYRKLWDQLGQLLLDAWKYSFIIGKLPYDQRLSAITLLPKQGKNLEKIENWRPITLTNCDLKIFTKLLSNRVSKVLDKIVHPCQTAYIPGRVVHDNLRVFDFYNSYCKENDIDAILISLDAKKAFDSVSHKYMHKVLAAYGFSENFIDTVKLLYKDIQAQILVNGYKSTIIKILRSVKQGDALSCALFILCIDPLIRKIDSNPLIKAVPIPPSRYSNIKVSNKINGFADDIGLAVKNDKTSIDNIFNDYKLFSKLSGIELNLDKTEILKLNNNTIHQAFTPCQIQVKDVVILTKESIKICGIYFSNNSEIAYERNVLGKIEKMEKQLIIWLQRALSIEGKNLIVKTFGLSQLIYSLQMCNINDREIIDIERMIFKFLWNKKWVGSIAPDRIKRDILKLPFEKGGINVPDIKFLNTALKIKQFVRSMKSSHPINMIQKFQLEKIGYFEYYKCEYSKLCKADPIIEKYQLACNLLTDRFRNFCSNLPLPEPKEVASCVNIIASTDVLEYLKRKNYLLIINRFSRLSNLGVTSYYQLVNEVRFPRSDEMGELASYILRFFPTAWIETTTSVEHINDEITYENEFPSCQFQLIDSKQISVKNIRNTLVETLRIYPHPFMDYEKFQLENLVNNNPFIINRKANHSPRDRFFKYRILQGDIFCNERCFRFKMVESAFCSFCAGSNHIETIKHVLWDCPRSSFVWNYFSNMITRAYNLNYISYTSIVVGSERPILIIETLITSLLKLILTKDRTNVITKEMIDNQIRLQYILELHSMRDKRTMFDKRWEKLKETMSLANT